MGSWRTAAAALFSVAVSLTGCSSGGGGGGGGGGDGGPPPTVLIAPPPVVTKSASVQLSATVVDAAPGVTWAVEGGNAYGTITAGGIYTAPSAVPDDPVVVRATSTDDPRGTDTATIRVVVGDVLSSELNNEISPRTGKANTFSGGQRSVAVHGSTVYAVWNDDSSGNDDVYLAISRDRGMYFEAPVRINDDAVLGGIRPQFFPSVGVDGSGRAVMAWLDGRSYAGPDAKFDVYVATATIDSNGAVVIGANQGVILAGTPDTQDVSVSLAVDQPGNVYLAWADGSGASNTDILLVKGVRTASGLFQFSPAVLVNQYVSSDQGRPAVAVDGTGDLLVAWHSRTPIPGQLDVNWEVYWRRGRFDAGGAITWETDETRVNLLTEGDQVSPTVAMVWDGAVQTAYIGWSQQIGLQERRKLYFAKSSSPDLTVGENIDVMQSESDQNFPSLVVSGGHVTIAVADNRPCSCTATSSDVLNRNGTGATDIYLVRSTDGGQSFAQPVLPVNSDEASLKLHGRPSVAVDDVGRAYAVWTDDRNGVSQAFMARAE